MQSNHAKFQRSIDAYLLTYVLTYLNSKNRSAISQVTKTKHIVTRTK